MMQKQHQHNGHNTIDRLPQSHEIIAHFLTEAQAQQAAEVVADQVESTHVEEITSEQAQQELTAAQTGLSLVEIGLPAWVGLALGLIVGAALGVLVYTGRLVFPGLAPALSAGPVAVSFLGAGLFGALGWFAGAILHLFRTPGASPRHELRAIVPEETLPGIEQTLVDAGALDVLTPSDGVTKPTDTEHQGSHH